MTRKSYKPEEIVSVERLRAPRLRGIGQRRSTQRKTPQGREDEEQLTADII